MKRTTISILLFASCVTTYYALNAERTYYYTKHVEPKDTAKKLKCGKDYLRKLEKILTKTEIISSITPQDLQSLLGAEFRCFLDTSEQDRVHTIVSKIEDAQRQIKVQGAQTVETYYIGPARYSIRSLMQRISNQVNDLQSKKMFDYGDEFLMKLRNLYSKTNMQALALITPQELHELQGTKFRDFLGPYKQELVNKIVLLIENAQRNIKVPGTERIVEKDYIIPAKHSIEYLMQIISDRVDNFGSKAWKL